MMRLTVFVGALAAAAITPPARAQATLESEIRAEVARYSTAVSRGDARGVADLYARTPGVSSAGDGEITVGWPAILDLYENFLEQLGRVTMTVDSLTVTPVGQSGAGAVALFHYRWLAVRDRDTTSLEGAMTLVYERTPQGWRIVHDHTSTRGDAPVDARAGAGEPAAIARPLGPTERCLVERIVDGDTFVCNGGLRVRLIGVDAPEASQRPFGAESKAALERQAPPGNEVTLERDATLNDRYGRRLAYVWRGSVFVNWQLVRGGWVVLLTIPPNVRYSEAFVEAQRRAREARAGLWAEGGFDCSPTDRRRGKCDT